MSYSCTRIGLNVSIISSDDKDLFILKLPHNNYGCRTNMIEKKMYEIMNKRSNNFIKMISGDMLPIKFLKYDKGNKYQKFITIKTDDGQFDLNHTIYDSLRDISISKICVLKFEINKGYSDIHKTYMKEGNIYKLGSRLLRLCDIIHDELRPMNFIHGDFKISNILTNEGFDIKLIDLEGSIILLEEERVLEDDDDVMLYAYLRKCGVISKAFLFIFDLTVTTMSILCMLGNSYNILLVFLKEQYKYIKALSQNKAFLDIFVLLILFEQFRLANQRFLIESKYYSIVRDDSCVNCTYDIICRLFSQNISFTDQTINSHYQYMKNTIVSCDIKNEIICLLDQIIDDVCMKQRPTKILKTADTDDVTTDSLTYSPDKNSKNA